MSHHSAENGGKEREGGGVERRKATEEAKAAALPSLCAKGLFRKNAPQTHSTGKHGILKVDSRHTWSCQRIVSAGAREMSFLLLPSAWLCAVEGAAS